MMATHTSVRSLIWRAGGVEHKLPSGLFHDLVCYYKNKLLVVLSDQTVKVCQRSGCKTQTKTW